jgi:hypothetical protein
MNSLDDYAVPVYCFMLLAHIYKSPYATLNLFKSSVCSFTVWNLKTEFTSVCFEDLIWMKLCVKMRASIVEYRNSEIRLRSDKRSGGKRNIKWSRVEYSLNPTALQRWSSYVHRFKNLKQIDFWKPNILMFWRLRLNLFTKVDLRLVYIFKYRRTLIFILTNQLLALIPLVIKSLSHHEHPINSVYDLVSEAWNTFSWHLHIRGFSAVPRSKNSKNSDLFLAANIC